MGNFPLGWFAHPHLSQKHGAVPHHALYRRLWVKRAAFLLLFGALCLGLYRQFHPPSAWAILVEGEPAALVARKQVAQQILSSILRTQAGAFVSQARFRQKVAIEEVRPPDGNILGRWKAQQQVSRRLSVVIPASWMMVEGKELVALPSRSEAEQCLRAVVWHYLPRGARLVGEPKFKETIDFREEMVSPAKAREIVVSREEGIKRLLAPSVPPTEYLIRRGDTASGIAARFKVSLEDLRAANPDLNLERLRPGEKIVVAGGRPPVTVVFRAWQTSTREIPFWTEFVPSASLAPGEKKTLRAGRPGKQIVRSLITYVNGKETSRISRAGEVVAGPSPARIAVGVKKRDSRE